jgi:hypothetical protein
MIVVAVAIAAAVSWWYYRTTNPPISLNQRRLLAILRVITLSILLLLVLNPILRYTTSHRVRRTMVLLTDTSQSMDIPVNNAPKSALWRDAIQKTSTAIKAAGYRLVEYNFAADLNGDDTSTNLSTTLQSLQKELPDTPLDGIVLQSDGYFKDANLESVLSAALPVHSIIPDYSAPGSDVAITEMRYNKTTYRGEETPVAFTLDAGSYTGVATVTLFVDDDSLSTRISFADSPIQQIILNPHFDSVGLHRIRGMVTADSLAEAILANNQMPGAIHVMNDRQKMLILADQLNWDVKFLKDTINRNPHWKADVRTWHNGWFDGRDEVNLAEQLSTTSVVCIVNSGSISFDNQQQRILSQRLHQGNGILLMGAPVADLSSITPSENQGINRTFSTTFQLTAAGRGMEILAPLHQHSAVPPVTYYYTRAKAESRILATMDNEQHSPAISSRTSGKGLVMQLNFLDLWRWQLRQGDTGYSQLLDALLQALAAGETQRFMVQSKAPAYFLGEEVEIQLHAYDEALMPRKNCAAEITISSADTVLVQDFMHPAAESYRYTMEQLGPGTYTVRVQDGELQDSTSFAVLSQSPEVRDTGINQALLRYVSDITGGKVIGTEDLSELTLPTAQSINMQREHRIPLYRKWYIITLFLLSFCVELYLRKRWGLL